MFQTHYLELKRALNSLYSIAIVVHYREIIHRSTLKLVVLIYSFSSVERNLHNIKIAFLHFITYDIVLNFPN